METLYVIGTPIGNLEDITLRAIRILKEVDVIACEDTRITKRLLERYEILNKRLVSYNEKESGSSIQRIIVFLKEGKTIALVSDAGTPTVSDPGARLVFEARAAGIRVVAVPGANAATAALSISGLPSSELLFLGFLPHKKGREKIFTEIAKSKRTVVLYESPHRIIKTLTSLHRILSINRKVLIARELTKIHEEIISGTAQEVLQFFEKNTQHIKGEFVVIVEGM